MRAHRFGLWNLFGGSGLNEDEVRPDGGVWEFQAYQEPMGAPQGRG